MGKKVLFIVPPDRFNDDELFIPKGILENAGIEVTISSLNKGEITGDNKGTAVAEALFSEVPAADYDAVSVIGGSGTPDYLWGNEQLIDYLKQAYEQKVLVTGICAGSVAVAQTGLLSGRPAACYPVDSQINELQARNVEYAGSQHVVAHDDIITGDGPDGAQQFGESLVKALS
ncbi:DJ-1/PfpI family protein [Paenibacillus beijingensis]|uniref:Peptidase n=1 Tax=Paenibacillus beijingensis TaxID=1126833 RepID=A0A0D5NIJ1_9BACL|nr:DJ-1/PfpI family protein [Paenibacillus beijingensis]AJY74792.1 peptidase [Paenibacillus beijingensis]